MTAMARPIAIEHARIFIQIPSYRDRECQWTIRDAFAKASHPDRIFAGVCWQFDPEADRDCFTVETRPAQVRRIDFHANEAKGLGWARLQAQSLWRGEAFTLQIDSHMRFAPGWDVTLLRQLERCPSPWPVLTIYPPSYWPPDVLETASDMTRAVQRVRGFGASGILQFTVDWVPAEVPASGPKITAGLAGGFLFGPSRIITDVPSDPMIYFEGEEPNLAIRLWTSGFDLFSPDAAVAYHYYRRSDSRRPWDDANPTAPNAASLQRMRQLVTPGPGDAERLGRYGLGTARSLAEYELFAGVDFRAQSVADYAFHYPFVFTSEMAAALAARIALRPADGAGLLFLGADGLLFSPRRKALYRLTPAASFMWSGIEEGLAGDAIVAALAARADLPADLARDRFHAQLCHWAGLGLLRGDTPPRDPIALPEPRHERRAIRPPLDHAPRDDTRLLLGRTLRVRCWDAEDAALLAPLLSCLPAAPPESAPAQTIEVLGVGDYRYVIRDSLFPPITVATPVHLAAAFHAALDSCIANARDALQHLRGFVADDAEGPTLFIGDGALLAPLAGALRASPFGGGGGVAERIGQAEPGLYAFMRVQIGRGDGRVRPVPSPMLVPRALFDARRAALSIGDDLPTHEGFSFGAAVIPAFDAPADGAGAQVRRVVVLESGEADALAPLAPADALMILLAVAMPTPALADLDAAAELVDWIEARDCLRLTAGSPAAARTLLRRS